MKTLPQVDATAEQLPLISQNRFGVEVICGAAGSGKTSTALMRLRSLFFMAESRRIRRQDPNPVRVLVLTFNRTLAGYVRNLAESQIAATAAIDLDIDTFGRWAMTALQFPDVLDDERKEAEIHRLARAVDALTSDYVLKEVDYLLGRFEPENLEDYISTERTGRGLMPRVDRRLRRRILDDVVYPYRAWLAQQSMLDWNDLAVRMAREVPPIGYDIVIVDESQDFSANQLRAIRHHLKPEHAITFVIDTVQRIYARGFTWTEAGYDVRPERVHTLRANHRNTVEIASFAAGILSGMGVEGDGALPNLTAASAHGPPPIALRGVYSDQLAWTMHYIDQNIDLSVNSVAFLKPRSGAWFDAIRAELGRRGLAFADITRRADWPVGPENIALSTFHSAKGLEFDYVFILGFTHKNTPHAGEDVDDEVFVLRRLLAVAVARARKAVIVGYKPGEESRLIQYFAPGTFDMVDV